MPEKAHRRVPGGVVAAEHPPPFRHMLEGDKDGPRHGSRQMSDGGIHRNNQVEIGHDRGRIKKGAGPGVKVIAEGFDRRPRGGDLFDAITLLKTDEAAVRKSCERGETCKRGRAGNVDFGIGVPLPCLKARGKLKRWT